jgi:hypothetical protein
MITNESPTAETVEPIPDDNSETPKVKTTAKINKPWNENTIIYEISIVNHRIDSGLASGIP